MKIEFPLLPEYIEKIYQLGLVTDKICKAAVWEGAAVVHKAVEEEIDGLPLWGKKYGSFTADERDGLKASCGFAKMEVSGGSINTKLGFTGYNPKKTKLHPKGIPNALLARSILRGTSFMWKNDFVGRAVRRSKEQATKAMQAKVDELISKTMK